MNMPNFSSAPIKNYAPVFNVKSYGAQGNGTITSTGNDDSAAINNAIAAAAANNRAGAVVYFPGGSIYDLQSEIVCNSPNISFVGDGYNSSIIRQNNFGLSGIQIYGDACRVQNLGFVNPIAQTVIGGANYNGSAARSRCSGVYVANANYVTVEDVMITNFSTGIYFIGNTSSKLLHNFGNRAERIRNNSCPFGLVSQQQEDAVYTNITDGVNTFSANSVSAGASVVITPNSMVGIWPGMWLQLGTGFGLEHIQVASITATTFTCVVKWAHAANFAIQSVYVAQQGNNPPHQVYLTGQNQNQISRNITVSNCVTRNNIFGSGWALKFTDGLNASNLTSYNCERGIEPEGLINFTISNILVQGTPNMTVSMPYLPSTYGGFDTLQAAWCETDNEVGVVNGLFADLLSPWLLTSDVTDQVAAGSTNVTLTVGSTTGMVAGGTLQLELPGTATAEQVTISSVTSSTQVVISSIANQHGGTYSQTDTTDTFTSTNALKTFTVPNTTGLVAGQKILIGSELTSVSSLTSTTITAQSAVAHTQPFTIQSVGFPIFIAAANTTDSDSSTTTFSPGSNTFTPVSMQGIAVNTTLDIDVNSNQERVVVTAITATTFTCTTVKGHQGGFAIVGYGFSDGIKGVSVRSFNSQNAGGSGSTDIDFNRVRLNTYYSTANTTSSLYSEGQRINFFAPSITHYGDNTNSLSKSWYMYKCQASSSGSVTATDTADTTVSPGTNVVLTLPSTNGFGVGMNVRVDTGGATESTNITAITPTTITVASLSNTHLAPFNITNVISPDSNTLFRPYIKNATTLFTIGSTFGPTNTQIELDTDVLPSGITSNSYSLGNTAQISVKLFGSQPKTLALNSSTQSVAGAVLWKTNSSSQTLVTQITGFLIGQPFLISASDGNTILVSSKGTAISGGNIILKSPVNTTVSSTSSSGAATLNVSSVTNMYPGQSLVVNYGNGTQEIVKVRSVPATGTAVTLFSNLANTHSATETIYAVWQSSTGSVNGNRIVLEATDSSNVVQTD